MKTTNDTLTEKQIAKLESLTYTVPPVCQGQIVEVAYAGVFDCGDGWVVMRWHDRSDGTVTYHVADWADGDDFEPWNCEPTVSGEYHEVEGDDAVLRAI